MSKELDPKAMLLTSDERVDIALNSKHGQFSEALARGQVRKIADWIEEMEGDNTHLHTGDLVNRLREAASE